MNDVKINSITGDDVIIEKCPEQWHEKSPHGVLTLVVAVVADETAKRVNLQRLSSDGKMEEAARQQHD